MHVFRLKGWSISAKRGFALCELLFKYRARTAGHIGVCFWILKNKRNTGNFVTNSDCCRHEAIGNKSTGGSPLSKLGWITTSCRPNRRQALINLRLTGREGYFCPLPFFRHIFLSYRRIIAKLSVPSKPSIWHILTKGKLVAPKCRP